eukprot:Amastigsp_a190761_18.p3 type:complete len:161 gc:universal Amastigsp_a190761_18:693-211(-)
MWRPLTRNRCFSSKSIARCRSAQTAAMLPRARSTSTLRMCSIGFLSSSSRCRRRSLPSRPRASLRATTRCALRAARRGCTSPRLCLRTISSRSSWRLRCWRPTRRGARNSFLRGSRAPSIRSSWRLTRGCWRLTLPSTTAMASACMASTQCGAAAAPSGL